MSCSEGRSGQNWTICKDETPESPCRGNWRNGWVHPILPRERSLLSLRQTRVSKCDKQHWQSINDLQSLRFRHSSRKKSARSEEAKVAADTTTRDINL